MTQRCRYGPDAVLMLIVLRVSFINKSIHFNLNIMDIDHTTVHPGYQNLATIFPHRTPEETKVIPLTDLPPGKYN